MRISALPLLLWAATSLSAEEPFLGFPVDCELGADCFVEDYFDANDAEGKAADYTCGYNTRDAHYGVDVALITWESIEENVQVLAAADGTVLRTRDSMVDDRRMPGVNDNNACGNAVLLDHPNGYQTLYCHLRRGSVSVSPGDKVTSGTPLGAIGLSGQTTHPHLHLTVLKDQKRVDPFNPEGAACGEISSPTLWLDPPPYDQTLLRLAGFSSSVPDYEALRGGTARKDEITSTESLIVYAELGFAEDGDVVTISATGPLGEVFTHERVMEAPRVSQLPAYGKRAPSGGWESGEYTGQITVKRDGRLVANRWAHVTVTE